MSDHRPVSASFDLEVLVHPVICSVQLLTRLKVPEIDTQAYKETAEALLRRLGDFEESEKTAKLKITPSEVDFGKVGYARYVLAFITGILEFDSCREGTSRNIQKKSRSRT